MVATEKENEAHMKPNILLYIGLILAIAAPVSVALIWFSQQKYAQYWNSKPIVEIYVDRTKTLVIKNVGVLDVEGITTSVSTYTFTPDYPLKVSKATIESVSRWSGEPRAYGALDSGKERKIDLKVAPYKVDFYRVPDGPGGIDIPDPIARRVYCLRVVFRNAVTKEKFVRYVLTGTTINFIDQWDEKDRPGSGGGYVTQIEIFRLRDLVKKHESLTYEDPPESIYRNGPG